MKKNYMAPEIEKIEFKYCDQVVAASVPCGVVRVNVATDGSTTCSNWADLENKN